MAKKLPFKALSAAALAAAMGASVLAPAAVASASASFSISEVVVEKEGSLYALDLQTYLNMKGADYPWLMEGGAAITPSYVKSSTNKVFKLSDYLMARGAVEGGEITKALEVLDGSELAQEVIAGTVTVDANGEVVVTKPEVPAPIVPDLEVANVMAINKTSVQVTFGKALTAAELADKTLTLKSGDTTLTATFVSGSYSDKTARFALETGKELTDAAAYTVTSDWASFAGSFVAKVAPATINSVQFTTNAIAFPKNEAATTGAKLSFNAFNQYGEAIAANTLGSGVVTVRVTYNGSPVATVTNLASENTVTIKSSALVDGREMVATAYKTVDGNLVAIGSKTLTVKQYETLALGSINTLEFDGTYTDLKAGDKVTLTTSVLDEFGNVASLAGKNLRWVTSDKSIVAFETDSTKIHGDHKSNAATRDFVDASAGENKMDFVLGKEGTATITVFTPDLSASKTFAITVGQGELSVIDTSNIDLNTDFVVNKATLSEANIAVNNVDADNYLVFENANNTQIPVRADLVTFEVTPKTTGFNASDVKVEKVVDAAGYLTGLKVTSDRTTLTTLEKAGDYSAGVGYTVTVKSSVTGVSNKTFDVTSKIDSKVASIETASTATFRAGNTAEQELVFKNAKGEVLNVRANDVSLTSSNNAKITNTKAARLLTHNADGKTVANNGTTDVVKGIKFAVETPSTDKGTYSMLINVGAVAKTVNITVTDQAKITSINVGANTSVVSADTTKVFRPIEVRDQDGTKMTLAPGDLQVGSALIGSDDVAGAFAIEYYKTNNKGEFVSASAQDAVGIALTINPNHSSVNDFSQANKAVVKVDNKLTGNNKIESTVEVTFNAKRVLDKLTVEKTNVNIGLGGTQFVKFVPVDQYGKLKNVASLTIASSEATVTNKVQLNSTTGVLPTTGSSVDFVAVDKDGKVVANNSTNAVAYLIALDGKTTGTSEITLTADAKEVKFNVNVATAASLVKSLKLTHTNINADGNFTYKVKHASANVIDLDFVAYDANGVEVAIDKQDVVWTTSDRTVATVDADGKVTTQTVTGADKEVTITADVFGVKKSVKLVVSKDAATIVDEYITLVDAKDLDSDKDKAGIQLLLDGEEGDGTLTLTFTALDQFGEAIDLDLPVLAVAFDRQVATVGTAFTSEVAGKDAQNIKITPVKEGSTQIRVTVGAKDFLFDLIVKQEAVDAYLDSLDEEDEDEGEE